MERRDEADQGKRLHDLICWTPDSESQVHRFTSLHAFLHLGIDVLYLDMDTFLLRDPIPRILARAEHEGLDALFAGHGDADCINIGVFFLKAGGRTSVWMSQYLTWYHDHPFEIDQRGLHVFLRLPAAQLRVAYVPEDLVEVRGGIIDDVNEIVIGASGWHGRIDHLFVFHWCSRPLYEKEVELNDAYDAADALESFNFPLPLALATASSSPLGFPWAKVLQLRAVLESYYKHVLLERSTCW